MRKLVNKAVDEKTMAGESPEFVRAYVMNDIMPVRTGKPCETAPPPLRTAVYRCNGRVSSLRKVLNRCTNPSSHPKYLTSRTASKTSCVRDTRVSVVLSMAFLCRNITPTAPIKVAKPMTRSPRPASTETQIHNHLSQISRLVSTVLCRRTYAEKWRSKSIEVLSRVDVSHLLSERSERSRRTRDL